MVEELEALVELWPEGKERWGVGFGAVARLDDWREAKLFELPEVYLLPVLNPLDPAPEELDLPEFLGIE